MVRLFLNPCLNRSQAQQTGSQLNGLLKNMSTQSTPSELSSPVPQCCEKKTRSKSPKNQSYQPIISSKKKTRSKSPKNNHINQSYLPKKKQGQNHPKTRCQETFSMLFHGGISAGLSGIAVMVSQQRCKALALSLSEMVQEN